MIPSVVASTSERRKPLPPYMGQLCVVLCVMVGRAKGCMRYQKLTFFLICRISGYQISLCRRRPIHSIPQSQRLRFLPNARVLSPSKGEKRTRGSCTPCPAQPLFPTPLMSTHTQPPPSKRPIISSLHRHHTSTLLTNPPTLFHEPPSPSSLNPAYSVP